MNAIHVRTPRGETLLQSEIPSPIAGVPSAAWHALVRVLETQPRDHISPSGALGCFEMRPQRLQDIGVMTRVRSERSPSGHRVWVGEFTPPNTRSGFLKSYLAQYNALASSLLRYLQELSDEASEGMSLSGELAILHRAGPSGLLWWSRGRRFDGTEDLFRKANGLF